MSCKFINTHGGAGSITCKRMNDVTCPYQYWCTNDKCYKTTATRDKCKYYEEAENSEQLNKK